MSPPRPALADQPADLDDLVRRLLAATRAGARHLQVCAVDRRAWLLSRMDPRSRSLMAGLDLTYPTSRVVSALWRRSGWPGRGPISTEAALKALLGAAAAGPPLRVFHFGDRPGKGAAVMARLGAAFPSIEAVGVRSVLDELWGPENNQALFKITAARPDLLLVALPSPLQEEWIHAHAQLVDAGILWGIGRGDLNLG